MKVALIFLALLTSLSIRFASQETSPIVCRGKPLTVTMLEKPGVEMRVPPIPIRFGGSRYGPVWQLHEKPVRLVIKNRDEFSADREIEVPCAKWDEHLKSLARGTG